MNGLTCISLDYRAADTSERASWSAGDHLRRLKAEGRILEGLLLTTCNRTELYLRLPPGAATPPELFHPKARTYAGTELTLHLLRVLLGLESIACGESHIAAQVKSCYSAVSDLCGPCLHRLFQSSLKMAKLLRTCYHPGLEPSIPRLMIEELAGHPSSGGLSVLVLGTGAMGEETARLLLSTKTPDGQPTIRSLALANRTAERANVLVKKLASERDDRDGERPRALRTISWKEWRDEANGFDAIFFCTGSPLPLFSMEEARDGQSLFDLGSPPQVARNPKNNASERSEGSPKCPEAVASLLSIDDLAGTAEKIAKDYRKKLGRLEAEAANAAVSVMSEIETLSGETYKRLVLHRAEGLVNDRAERTAKRIGTDEETLRKMGWSIVKALLSPAFAESDPHARRLWKILAGELAEQTDE